MQVAIVGLGLMGGGLVDRLAATADEAAAEADLVVVATPVSVIPVAAGAALQTNGKATVTDLGSTKGHIVDAIGGDGAARVVGGHPICGSEAHGAAHARSGLFEGATWFLTPSSASDPGRFADLHALVARLGARPVVIDADAHDRLVSLTSHLPHVLANVLALQVAEADVEGHRPLAATGGSFRDMTRVAGANAPMWTDILLDNRDAVLAAVRDAQDGLGRVAAALERGDGAAITDWIHEAAGARREALALAHRAEVGDLFELIVDVPDRPGAIAAIAQALSADGIGIREFALSHISAASGGEIRLVVGGADAAERALERLHADGYSATAEPVGHEEDDAT
jgi:prephenate dehydrogenase